MKYAIIQKIESQKEKLIKKYPSLKHYFIPIKIPQWDCEIPFLPIRCFRDFDLHSTFTEENAAEFQIYNSSGSTGNKRSRHIFSKQALNEYEMHTSAGFREFLTRHQLPQHTPIVSFVPPPEAWPTSSLAAMISMFSKQGFCIEYCNLEEKKENLISLLEKLPNGSSCILFGTTFHHLMLIQSAPEFTQELKKHFKRLSLAIIDTGGTKGRTQAFTLEETRQMFSEFYCSPQFSFLSEYGMCELSSQAWSTQKIHDGSFTCNPQLFPFAIDLNGKTSLSKNELGFIGFIDLVNTESWGAIITEDIGVQLNEKSFQLIGRGPDASIKGCSLNVRSFFQFEENNEKRMFVPAFFEPKSQKIELSEIRKILKEQKKWDDFFLADLLNMARSIEGEIPKNTSLENKHLYIISAANTPIAWLFPYLIAANSKAASVTIKIPSLRLDDYFASSIIEKTKDLISVFCSYFIPMPTYIDMGKSLTKYFDQFDAVLTFGTDETLNTIHSQIDTKKTEFYGFGDVKNSAIINIISQSAEQISDWCSYWNGRGCLTPVALFLEEKEEQTKNWIKLFQQNFETQMNDRLENTSQQSHILKFTHAHNVAFVCGQVEEIGLQIKDIILRGERTCVVNLTQATKEQLDKFKPEWGFGGAGFVYLFPAWAKNKWSELKQNEVLPAIENFQFNNNI